jgi:4'-phosphopantetheinyl transferase
MENRTTTPPTIGETEWLPCRECSWQIAATEVHLWRIDPATVPAAALTGLSSDEQARAAAFVRDSDRQRFVARRHALRQLLARYGQITPGQITFRLTRHGKPSALDAQDRRLAPFSLSSRDQLILIAFGTSPLGVDVEHATRDVEINGLARRFFHPDEAAEITARDGPAHVASFFHCWARKEAYVKAVGRGLHLPLHQFRVSVAEDRAELLWRDPAIGDRVEWRVRPLLPRVDYVGALVHAATSEVVRCFDYEE